MEILVIAGNFSVLQNFISQLVLVENLGKNYARFSYQEKELDILISGTGGSVTSYFLTKSLNFKQYDFVIHLGRCFSLKDQLESGIVVNVIDDYFGDMGFGANESFSSVFDLGMQNKSEFPFVNEMLENNLLLPEFQSQYRKVSGISCNAIPNSLFGIANMYLKNHPDIISRDGASVLYICMEEKVKLLQLFYVVDRLENASENYQIEELEVAKLTEALEVSLAQVL
ncbi:hypothetical protein BZG02_01070 [Labilibaculum filiforme]|uniref:Nucleoside phosphorylase domain-containing protein n=1 Tax=Labilibaculum filiforme TaxID=1940526 RepID=A0A2N3I5Q1_9BACT|nr:hypothetical protein [Labilibaculum filiforme]PKQ65626.1 hypothetical protein BZG02_01070 [Labilibaculum filiforme]